MKILYILSDTALGGAQRVMTQLAIGMQVRGHNVSVGVLVKDRGYFRKIIGPLLVNLREINYQDYEIIHCDGYVHQSWKMVKGIVTWFDSIHSRLSYDMSGAGGKKICVSPWLHEMVQSRGMKSFYIPNGVDVEIFKPIPGTRSLENRSVVGIGRFAKVKNYSRFQDIARIVNKQDPGIKFYIIGDAHNREEQQEKSLIDQGLITILGDVTPDCMATSIPNFWVLLSTSLEEGFGMNLIEAMACAVPVISTRSKGSACIIKHGIDGHIEDNNEIIAKRILFLCNPAKEKRYAEIAAWSREKVVSQFSLKLMLDRYEALYGRER